MKNYCFHGDGFSLFCMRDTKIRMTPSRLPRRAGTETVPTLWPCEVNFKIWAQVRSGQGQVMVRSWPKYVNMHIIRSSSTSQVVWHHLRISISIVSWLICKEWLWKMKQKQYSFLHDVTCNCTTCTWCYMYMYNSISTWCSSQERSKTFIPGMIVTSFDIIWP